MGGQKALRLVGRFEPAHLALLLARALVGQHSAVVQPLVLTMLNTGHHCLLGGGVALELVGIQHPGDIPEALEELAKEALGGFGMASALDKNVEGMPLLIDRPSRVLVLAIHRDDHFIQVPFLAPPGLPMPQLVRECVPESESPLADGLVGHEDAPGCEQFVDVPKGEGEANREPDRVGNNLGGEAVAAIEIRWRFHSPLTYQG